MLLMHIYLHIQEHAFSGHCESDRVIINRDDVNLTGYEVTSKIHASFEEFIDLVADLACCGLNSYIDTYGITVSFRVKVVEGGASIT